MSNQGIVTVQVHGLSQLEEALKSLAEAAAGQALAEAVRAGAAVIRDEAKQRAPVGSVAHYVGRRSKNRLVQPGNLRKQIRMKRLRKTKFSVAYSVGLSKLGFYGQFVEFGTTKMRAQPFLRPAFDSKKEAAVQAIKERLALSIEKARKKAHEASMRAYRGE